MKGVEGLGGVRVKLTPPPKEETTLKNPSLIRVKISLAVTILNFCILPTVKPSYLHFFVFLGVNYISIFVRIASIVFLKNCLIYI